MASKEFNPGQLTKNEIDNLILKLIHDEGAEVYINGVLAASLVGWSDRYLYASISKEAKQAIRPNAENSISVHCHQTDGRQVIDVGMSVQRR